VRRLNKYEVRAIRWLTRLSDIENFMIEMILYIEFVQKL